MDLNFNTFQKHIHEFNADQYNSFEDNFYELYLKLKQEEIEKTKQLNAKFSKNTYDKNKHFKLNRNNSYGSEFKKVCSFESIGDENDKLNIIIRTYLNKISTDTYEKVSEQLIEKLIEIKNVDMFTILSEEIVNKCIYDNKYRDIYISLCSKIWSNKKIHYNLINIEKENDQYYAVYHENKHPNYFKLGPFASVDQLKEIIFKKLNFKNFFIDFIQELYANKEIDLDDLDDNQFFENKKKTMLLVELLSILFIQKHIQFDIINIIIIDLLHQNDNFQIIKEIEFELLFVMIKFIYEKNKTFKFFEQKKIIVEFKNILESILHNNKKLISKRSSFFIENSIIIFSKILNDEKYNVLDNNNESIEDKIIHDAKFGKVFQFKLNLEKSSLAIKKKCIQQLTDDFLENTKNTNILNCLKEFDSTFVLFMENYLHKLIENIEDIILDIPNIQKNMIYFINELQLSATIINKLENKINQLQEEEDDDEDFSFR
jgi:hypothetical protein